ncbi:MAG TPA: prolyl-tRNA synthetase associated domain-containing protein [Hyphomicrobiaceae bacterium]|nr:prolyl-tRNA synthetase associated domain-containing protein [Hyphomicrobiaceae bacterium]
MTETPSNNTKADRAAVFSRLQQLGIETSTVEHQAVFTVQQSDALERDLPGGHTKNLMLKDAKGRLFLVVAQAHTSINMKTLHKLLDCARLSFAKPEVLMAVLGVPPGSVTAFSLINDHNHDVTVIIDQSLMTYDVINCHPLENTATTAIARDDLMRFIRDCGHEPRIVPLAERADAG